MQLGSYQYDPAIEKLFRECVNTVFTIGVGNDGKNTDEEPFYPAMYNSDNIITVAACTEEDELAGFSNFGMNGVDIAAPGDQIMSTYIPMGSGFNYIGIGGTSMAAPFVASTAAVLRAYRPELSPREVIERICAGADIVAAYDGKINGCRRLNAYKALLEPTSTSSPSSTPSVSPALSPSSSPTPSVSLTLSPTATPQTGDRIEFKRTDNIVSGRLIFEKTTPPDESDIWLIAAYRKDGELRRVEIPSVTDMTTSFIIPEKFKDCEIEVYVWDKNMKPLMTVQKADI